jgi:hypothetical protein
LPPGYIDLTAARTSQPDTVALTAQLRAIDPTIGYSPSSTPDGLSYRLKKSSTWTPAQITNAQTVLDTVQAATPQRAAQTEIDNVPIATRSLMLMLLDEINVLRTEINTLRAAVSPPLTPPIPQRNETQAKNAWRNKAGTL